MVEVHVGRAALINQIYPYHARGAWSYSALGDGQFAWRQEASCIIIASNGIDTGSIYRHHKLLVG